MEEQILAVDLSTEQTLEVNLPEQDNVAQIDVYWQDEVVLDLDASLMYIVSGQQEIQDYVDNKSKPEIDEYIEINAKPIVTRVVEQEAKPIIDEYFEGTVKPSITEFAENEMAGYAATATAQVALAAEQAGIATEKANEASETAKIVNEKVQEFSQTIEVSKTEFVNFAQEKTEEFEQTAITATEQIKDYVENTAIPNITDVKDSAVSELESVLAADKSTLEGYVSSATNQASIASSKANEAQASASAAKTSETNAQASAVRSENSAVRAEEAKNLANEAVSKLGEFDSTVENAKEEIVSLSTAEQAVIVSNANNAKEVAVSEINSTKDTAIGEVEQAGSVIATYQYPIIPIAETSGSVSLATNTIYQMEITDAVAFVLPEVNTAVFNQIKVMAKITGTPTIDWGTTKFFDKKTPLIEEGCYDVYFDYDNLLSAWVCGVMDKG